MSKFLSLLDSNIKYILAAVLIVIPLYPKFPFLRIPGTYVSIRLEDFLMFFLAVLVIIKVIPSVKTYFKDKVISSILLFILVGAVSILCAVTLTKTTLPHIGILHLVRRIEYFIPFFAGYLLLRGKEDFKGTLEFLMKCLMIVILISFVYGVGQRYFSWPVIITQNEEYSKGIALRWIPGSHVNSTFAGHYDLATFLVLTLPVITAYFFTIHGKWTKASLGVTFLGGLWLLTNAVSRISVVSYLISACLALALLKKYKAILAVLFVSFVIFATSSSLMGRYARLKDIFSYLVPTVYAQEGSTREDRSTSIRLNVEWPRALRAFSKNPLLGTGYSSITLATDNDFLRLLGEIGILGFIAFVLILFRITKILISSLPTQDPFIAGVIGAFPGILLNSLFIDVFEASKFAIIFWLFMGITLFMIQNRNYE